MAKSADSNVEVILSNVRLSFSKNLFKPGVIGEGKRDDGSDQTPSYSCNFLIPKEKAYDPLIDKIEDAIDESAHAFWGKDIPRRLNTDCWDDGENYDYDGYPGNMVLKARAYDKPKIVHNRKDKEGHFQVLEESDGILYSGCYVNAVVRFWSQDHPKGGKRVNCSLQAVQFHKEGEAFGAPKVDADDKFKDFAASDDEPSGDFRRARRETTRDSGREDRDGHNGARRRERGNDRGGRSTVDREDRGRSETTRSDSPPARRSEATRDDPPPARRSGRARDASDLL